MVGSNSIDRNTKEIPIIALAVELGFDTKIVLVVCMQLPLGMQS